MAEGLNYLHANYTIHGDLKGVSTFFSSLQPALITLGQPNILVDHNGHARLTDFGLALIVRGMHSALVTQTKGYTAAWAAPEILEGADKIAREADMFAFGMVVIEVGSCTSSHLVLQVEGWMIRLTSEFRCRFLRESFHSVTSRPSPLF